MKEDNIHQDIINRYKSKLNNTFETSDWSKDKTRISHIIYMLDKLNTFKDKYKAMRWLGYIQGILACRSLIDIDEEIEFCRKYFKEV